MLTWFTRRRQRKRTAHKLYGSIVTQARKPRFYQELGVPDVLEGRFELLVLHMFLVLDRLRQGSESKHVAQELVDGFFSDMDATMREIGVGDLTVPKKMRHTAAAFYERLDDYGQVLPGPDPMAVDAVIRAYIYSGEPRPDAVAALRDYTHAVRHYLAEQEDELVRRGEIVFPDATGLLAPAKELDVT